MRYHIDASVTAEASERFGLSLNAKKTQVMVIGRHASTINIMYNGAPLELVKQFIYLGASFNEKGDTIKEVKRRVAIAKIASGDLHMIWRNRELPTPLKRKLVQLMIWPIMSYGSETWIYLQSVQNMNNVFERWSSSSSSSSLGSRCVPWLGEGLSMLSPNYPVLCFPLPYRVAPVFVQVVSPSLGWSPLSSFLVIWSPTGDTRGPSERWCYRRMLRISWTEHVTNEEVFNRANAKPTLIDGLLRDDWLSMVT